MNVIRFPTHLISTLEISEAVGWPHAELMRDARATAAVPGMPAEWFRLVNYRHENGSIQSAYNLTWSGVKMLLWNCSGPVDLRRRYAMRAIVTMTLAPGEFIRRFMLHVLPNGFHRIRHYGLLASCRTKAATLARARELIAATTPAAKMQCNDEAAASMEQPTHPCPCCGARMVIIETFAAGCVPRHRPTIKQLAIRIDTS
jgi:hypothetical protein